MARHDEKTSAGRAKMLSRHDHDTDELPIRSKYARLLTISLSTELVIAKIFAEIFLTYLLT